MSSLAPPRRLPLWTTVSTGKLPYRHTVVDSQRYQAPFLAEEYELRLLPAEIGFESWGFLSQHRPVDSKDNLMLPLWRILSRLGVPTATVDWPLTSPLPGELHAALSDRFFEVRGVAGEVLPPDLGQRAQLFETTTDELDPDLLARFGENPPELLRRGLAGDLWRQDLGLYFLAPEQNVGSLFLFLPGLRQISAGYFGGFSAVQFEGSRSADAAAASQKVISYYSQLDETLAKLWEAGRGEMWLVVVSVSGVDDSQSWTAIKRMVVGKPPIEGDVDSGEDGLYLFLGKGFARGAFVRKARLVDLVPTLLYGLGFPLARDLDGDILTEVFETSFIAGQPLSFVPSYETFSGPVREDEKP